MSCVCICVHVCACVCVMTLKRPDRLVLCQQMEACIIQSGGSFMLFLFLSHHGSQRQTKQDLATEEKRGLQVVLPHWPSGCLPSPCSDPHPYHTHTHTHNGTKSKCFIYEVGTTCHPLYLCCHLYNINIWQEHGKFQSFTESSTEPRINQSLWQGCEANAQLPITAT